MGGGAVSDSSMGSGYKKKATKPVGGMAARRRVAGGAANTSFPSPILDTSPSQDDVLENDESATENRMKTRFRSKDNTLSDLSKVSNQVAKDLAAGYQGDEKDISILSEGMNTSFVNDSMDEGVSMMNDTILADDSRNVTQNESLCMCLRIPSYVSICQH